MTIEEAIKIFKEVREELIAKETELSKQVFENLGLKAVELAIKVLEQQPCEDCISRQAVDDAIYDYSRSCDVNYEQIMEFIDKLPSVTPRTESEEMCNMTCKKMNEMAKAFYDGLIEGLEGEE